MIIFLLIACNLFEKIDSIVSTETAIEIEDSDNDTGTTDSGSDSGTVTDTADTGTIDTTQELSGTITTETSNSGRIEVSNGYWVAADEQLFIINISGDASCEETTEWLMIREVDYNKIIRPGTCISFIYFSDYESSESYTYYTTGDFEYDDPEIGFWCATDTGEWIEQDPDPVYSGTFWMGTPDYMDMWIRQIDNQIDFSMIADSYTGYNYGSPDEVEAEGLVSGTTTSILCEEMGEYLD